MQKEWKEKIPKKRLGIFNYDYQKNQSKKFWVDKGTEFAGEFEKLCQAEEAKVTLQGVRLRLLLLNVPYEPWKINLTDKGKFLDRSKFKNWPCSSQPWIPFLDRLGYKEYRKFRYLSILYRKPVPEYRKHKFKLETEFASPSMTYPSGRVVSHSLYGNFRKCWNIFLKSFSTHKKEWTGWIHPW